MGWSLMRKVGCVQVKEVSSLLSLLLLVVVDGMCKQRAPNFQLARLGWC